MENIQGGSKVRVKALERDDTLKTVAILTMLIDHIGYQFFPSLIFLRIIGRIAFPIFAYQIATGYQKTSNLKGYFKRLIIFSVISQIPYIYFSPGNLNIMPTLVLGLFAIYIHDKGYKPLAFLLIGVAEIMHFQYGGYGIAMILLFYIFYNDKKNMVISFLLLSLFYYYLSGGSIQYFSVLSLVFILSDRGLNIKLNKYIAYSFYPLHITIILLIKWAIY